MDMLLGGLAFAAIMLGQFAAVVAMNGRRKWHESQASASSNPSAPLHPEDRAGLLWS